MTRWPWGVRGRAVREIIKGEENGILSKVTKMLTNPKDLRETGGATERFANIFDI